jgi:hypothetical protein
MFVSSSDQDIQNYYPTQVFYPHHIKSPVLNEFIQADVIKRELLSFHSHVVEVSVFFNEAPRLSVIGARLLGLT